MWTFYRRADYPIVITTRFVVAFTIMLAGAASAVAAPEPPRSGGCQCPTGAEQLLDHVDHVFIGDIIEVKDAGDDPGSAVIRVRENFKAGRDATRWSMDDTYKLFPVLRERSNAPAGVLSGGEQQMLTISRTLMGDPDLIMIDEPTEGLAPQVVERIAELLRNIAGRGISILLVEQKLTIALRISHRLYVMGHGRIVFEGSPEDLRANHSVRQAWLEV